MPKVAYPQVKFWLECAIHALRESGCEPQQVKLAMREISGLVEPAKSPLVFPEIESLPVLDTA